jgi:hypothetical protein
MKTFKSSTVMNFSKKTFVVAGLAAAVSLAGCSSDNPDEGSASSSTSISGIAVDGYIEDATVYIDADNNGRKGSGEPSAFTDKDGYFTTGKDGTDYCSDNATAIQKTHCLKTSEVGSSFVIRTLGGFDIYTNELFLGSLARRVTPDDDGVVANQMISPLTSMLVDVTNTDAQQDLLDFFGLASSDLDADFLDSAGYSASTVNSAVKLHKVVTLFSEVFTEQYDDFGDERSFPETPNAIIYKELATRLAASSVLDQTTLTNAFNDAQATIRAIYDADDDLTAPGSVNGMAVIQNALDLAALVDNAIPTSTNFADAKSRIIGVETVLKKMIDGDSDVGNALTEAGNTGSGLYAAIDLALVGGYVDFTELTKVDYSAPNYADIAIVGGDSFADLANKQVYINLSEGGKTGSGYLFFNNEGDESGGELKLCLEYDDGNNSSTEFEETDGLLLSGSWEARNNSNLTLKLAGSISLKFIDKGMKNGKFSYGLSYGGEMRNWLSEEGILDETESQSIVQQPSNDGTCSSLLSANNSNQF